MKSLLNIAAILSLTTTGCLADWVEIPSPDTSADASADASQGQDVASQGSDVGGDAAGQDSAGDAGSDVESPVNCNTPSKDRLVSNGDGTWKDLLLGVDCIFVKTDGQGKRCLPIFNHQLGTDGFGNSDFPDETGSSLHQSADCISHQVFYVNPNAKGQFPKYGFMMLDNTTVKSVVNLVDPPSETVVTPDLVTGKAVDITGVYSGDPAQCQPKLPSYSVQGSDYKAMMISGGVASIPSCQFLTGFNLFADQP